jgi:hypothetical protein
MISLDCRRTSMILREDSPPKRGPIGSAFVPLQLPPSPMLVFARWIEHARDVAVRCPRDANPRKHRRPAERRRMTKAIKASLLATTVTQFSAAVTMS